MDEPHLLTSPLCARDLRGEWSRRTRQSLCRSSSLLATRRGGRGASWWRRRAPSDERHRQRSVGRPAASLWPRPRDGSPPARRREVIFRNRASVRHARAPTETRAGGEHERRRWAGRVERRGGGARGDAAAAAVVAAAGPSRGAATLRPYSVLLELSVFDGRLKRHEFVVRGEQTLDQVRAAAPLDPPGRPLDRPARFPPRRVDAAGDPALRATARSARGVRDG